MAHDKYQQIEILEFDDARVCQEVTNKYLADVDKRWRLSQPIKREVEFFRLDPPETLVTYVVVLERDVYRDNRQESTDTTRIEDTSPNTDDYQPEAVIHRYLHQNAITGGD
jgi:uridine kinase